MQARVREPRAIAGRGSEGRSRAERSFPARQARDRLQIESSGSAVYTFDPGQANSLVRTTSQVH